MSDKSALDLVIRFLKHGNVDSAVEEINKLKKAQEDAAAKGSSAMGGLSAAWRSWTSLAVTSASKIRLAFLTVLGPIGAIITIVQTVVSVFRQAISVVASLRKEHDGLALAAGQASDASHNLAAVIERFGSVSGVKDLKGAVSEVEKALAQAGAKSEELNKKLQDATTVGIGQLGKLISSYVSKDKLNDLGTYLAMLGTQRQRLAEIVVELQREAEARERARVKLDAELKIGAELDRLAMNRTDFALRQLEKEVEGYRKAGADKYLIDELFTVKRMQILEDSLHRQKALVDQWEKEIVENGKRILAEEKAVAQQAAAIISSQFGAAVAAMVTQSKNFRDAWTGALDAVAQAFVQVAAQKMAMEAMGPAGLGLGMGGMFGVGMGLSIISRGFKMAKGGIVTRPTAAIVGEAGPEAVVPLGKGGPQGQSRRSLLLGLSEEIRGASPEAVRFALDASRLASKHSRLA